MGKKIGNPIKNVVKNFTPQGQANYLLAKGSKAVTGKELNLIDKGFDALGLTGGGGGPGPELNKNAFDLSEQAVRYEKLLNDQREYNNAANRQLTDQLQQQARGEGPLAGARLRQAQNRNLAQTLAAAQAQGASPLATRNFLQMRGQSSRDLAELGQQEQLQAQQALASQLAAQGEGARQDITQGFGIARAPVDMGASFESQRYQGDVARQQMIKNQQNAILGGLLGAAGQAGGALITKSDMNSKKDIKPADDKIQAFLDALQAKQFAYKEPESAGAKDGKQIGIMAQDLEKSSLGSTLVKDTPAGKMVDTAHGFGAVLAAQANLNARLKALEGKKKKS